MSSTPAPARCCVCDRVLLGGSPERVAGRWFCERDHDRAVAAGRATFRRLGLVEAFALTVYVGLVVLVYAVLLGDGALPRSVGEAAVVAAIPSLTWLAFVYRRDLFEPEPIALVLGIFVFGVLLNRFLIGPLAAGIAPRVVAMPSAAQALVLATLVEGVKLAIVRFTVYMTDELDEPADGVVYTCAAGLGIAASSSLDLLLTSARVSAATGAMALCTIAASQVLASCALGAGIGQARFTSGRARRFLVLAGALVGAVLLDAGLMHLVRKGFAVPGGLRATEAGLFAGTAAAAMVVVHVLMNRLATHTSAPAP